MDHYTLSTLLTNKLKVYKFVDVIIGSPYYNYSGLHIMECREYRGETKLVMPGVKINHQIVELWGSGSCLPNVTTVFEGPFYWSSFLFSSEKTTGVMGLDFFPPNLRRKY